MTHLDNGEEPAPAVDSTKIGDAAGPETTQEEAGDFPGFEPEPPGIAVTLLIGQHDDGRPINCCKVISLSNGEAKGKGMASLHRGFIETRYVADLEELAALIASLRKNEALTYGVVPGVMRAPLVTGKDLERAKPAEDGTPAPDWVLKSVPKNAVARDSKHFFWRKRAPGILFIDYDPEEKGQGLDWKQVDDILCSALPALRETSRMWSPSSSSFVRKADGTTLWGAGGWRCRVVVDDASQIPRIGHHLYQTLWSMGHGYIKLDAAGRMLDRSLIDTAVWQPERIDFCAAPVLQDKLVRWAPEPEIVPGKPMLIAAEIPEAMAMNAWRETSPELAAKKEEARPESDEKKAEFSKKRSDEIIKSLKLKERDPRRKALIASLTRAVMHNKLGGDFEIHPDGGKPVTVADILAYPEVWHGKECADPIEPTYGDDPRIAIIYSNQANPCIVSHAHGLQRYTLIFEAPQPEPDKPLGGLGGPQAPYEQQGQFMVVRQKMTMGDREFSPGVYREEIGSNGNSQWFWLCTRLEVLGATRGKDQQNWGRCLEIFDMDNHRKVRPVPMSRLEKDPAEMRAGLRSDGLNRAPGPANAAHLEAYISMWRPTRRLRCAERVGWLGDAFVLPDAQIGGSEECILQVEGTAPEYEVRGTLDGWRREMADICVGNSRLVFAVSMGFAGPLLRLVNEEPGGFHFWSESSVGKTTLAHMMRSVWGVRLGSWRSTDNGAEGVALGANDTVLTLDEIGQADGRMVASVCYLLGNGAGKTRMMANASLRRHNKWCVLFLSTGELPIATKMLEDNQTARAGQAVRVIEVKADAGLGTGVFESIFTRFKGGAAEMAEHIRWTADYERGANPQCGHAARAFLAKLTEDLPRWTVEAERLRKAFIDEYCPEGADGQVRRACGRFGIVAAGGMLASRFGITGWADDEAKDAAARLFEDWQEQRGGSGKAEETTALAKVRLYLEQHGEARFTPSWDRIKHTFDSKEDGTLVSVNTVDTNRSTNYRAGFRKATDDGWEYYVLPEAWRFEICKGFDATAVAKAMVRHGWIAPADGRNLAKRVRIPGEGNPRVYVVLPSFLSAES